MMDVKAVHVKYYIASKYLAYTDLFSKMSDDHNYGMSPIATLLFHTVLSSISIE